MHRFGHGGRRHEIDMTEGPLLPKILAFSGPLILSGILFIFTASVLIAPLKAYRRHLVNALGSDQKEYTGILKNFGDTAVEREGVMYYPLCLNIGDLNEEEDDRLLYLDANLKRPDWQLGDRLYIRSCARFVSAWEKM